MKTEHPNASRSPSLRALSYFILPTFPSPATVTRDSPARRRAFDSQGISVLDVETRLDNIGLGQEITKATGGRMKLDRSTENLLAFNANGAGTAVQGDAKPEEKKSSWWPF